MSNESVSPREAMTNNTFIHVGIVKAASTTLQMSVFNRHEEIKYVGTPFSDRQDLRAFFLRMAMGDETSNWQSDLNMYREKYVLPFQGQAKPLVMSYDQLCRLDRANRKVVAERLKLLVGNAKIIIVLRDQLDWLVSHFIFEQGNAVKVGFDDFMTHRWQNSLSGYRHFLNYQNFVQSYADVFGKENIGIFPFEELTRDTAMFSKRLFDFIGVDSEIGYRLLTENVRKARPSQLQYIRARWGLVPDIALGKLIPKPIHKMINRVVGERAQINISDDWRQEVEAYYAPTNRQLADNYGLDLAKFGYPV
jgi:hypothetical protein